jgi:mxaA protein
LLTGDKVRHVVRFEIAPHYRLRRSSLPPPRWITSSLELQEVKVEETREKTRRYTLTLDYQIFSTPHLVTLEVIPRFDLSFAAREGSFAATVPGWTYSISPLLKPEPEVEAVAEIPLRADAPPPLMDTTMPAYGLALFGGLSVLFGTSWLYFNALGPFGRRGRAPFAQACRALRRIRRHVKDASVLRPAFRVVHQAFNETAGEIVFAEHLERFFKTQPAFRSRREEVQLFFARSRQLFFGDDKQPASNVADLAWLESFCRQCRAAERGTR